MTATPALPAQQIAAPRPIRTGGNAGQATTARAAAAEDARGFESLYSQLRAQTGASATTEAEAGQAEAGPQPRRSRDARTEPLRAEDVLPMELLLTLYAQQQTTAMPRSTALAPDGATPAATPVLEGSSALEAALAAELPSQSAAALAAGAAQADLTSALAPAALPDAAPDAARDAGLPAAPGGASPAPAQATPGFDRLSALAAGRPGDAATAAPAAPSLADALARNAPPQAPAATPAPTLAPANFADQLAAAIKPAAPASTPAAPKRWPTPDNPAPAADPDAGQQPQTATTAAPTPAAAAAPVSGPTAEPRIMRPLDIQAGPKPVDGGSQSRQPQPAPRAETSADLRAAFSDLMAQQPEASPEADDALPPADRQRDASPVVTRQETALPQTGQPPAAHQAAERIIAELQSSERATPSERAESARRAEPPAPVRTLHIQLQPADLGTLTVKLSLRDQMLDIKLEAAEHRTAQILEADREKLTEILRSAGYALDGVTVQVSSPEKPVQTFNAMTGQGGNNQPQAGTQSQAGGAQSDAQRGQGSGRGNDDRSFASASDGGDHAPRRGSADGDVYI